MGEPLQQLGCTTLLDPRAAVNREVLLQPVLADPLTPEYTATRGSRLTLASFRWLEDKWPETISSPSRPTQIQTTRGLPSASRVARCASAPESISSRAAGGITVTAES